MNIFYNAITGFLHNEIAICLNELKGQITGIKAAKHSNLPCCDRHKQKHVHREYLHYNDGKQHPATGRRHDGIEKWLISIKLFHRDK